MLASSGAALTAVGRRRRRRSQLSVPSGADCLHDGPAGRGRVSSRGHFIVGRYRPAKRDVLPKRLGAVSSPTQAGRGGAARSHWRPRVASVPEAALELAASGLAANTPDLRPFAPELEVTGASSERRKTCLPFPVESRTSLVWVLPPILELSIKRTGFQRSSRVFIIDGLVTVLWEHLMTLATLLSLKEKSAFL